ncbi:SDR family NAD(P)-dependent oxidoreductase [candidate division KSB1 bacterium]|nr:SDR family NAD(P)-dependent oxidoreductase [candidate division KSB1 bacterium]NIR68590.1 SDR family NAD(P)-dependent oxidoreductase [candidate division KSB1 bacterium]NIS25427.1 SDR family NAD(P)-dependent oxidoreductase [candidate division KSB1 bacterium]NIT72319.1 SDR family NAD(P)-dependent oxidoreductase [candidate division KSB1 bacterium]NIU26103.1 SDR family NAD(P)-dependent oxidoreductase [candidate division KSB1 bacterium]
MSDLKGRKALITGGGRGIGREIALHFARAGLSVVLTARTERQLNDVAKEIEQLGGEVLVIPADVSQESEVERLAETVSKEWGAIDVLVNNAAHFARGKVVDLAVGDWDNVINTNLRGVFLVSRAFLPGMIKQTSGTIVMISSTSGKRADPGGAAYSTSKFGLMGFAQSLLYEVRKHNIRVIVVSPSWVDTRVTDYDSVPREGSGVRLCAGDVAQAILHSVSLPPRALVREIELWATNP